MTDLRCEALERAKRRRARRRRATPFAVSAAVAIGGVGALAWVAPRTGAADVAASPASASSKLAAQLSAAATTLHRLESTLAAQQGQIAAIASEPIPGTSSSAMAALPPLPAIPAPISVAPPAVHATTGASSAVP
ncbi:MAG TPA: hypothetical protein VNC61_14820 [Acidimicrobiales bacterium]|nr:hypothetical protein [Acidimicrobiales bacterium]